MLLIGGLTSASRWLVKPVVDKVFYYKDIKMLAGIVVLIPVLYLIIGVLTYVKNYINVYIANDTIRKLREDVFKHLQHISDRKSVV